MGRVAKRKSLDGVYSFSEPDFELSKAQVQELEKAGRLMLTPVLEEKINDAINFYIRQRERYSQSPSRGEVERHLENINRAVSEILRPLNSLNCNQNIDPAIDRAIQKIERNAPHHFEIADVSEQLCCLQEAVKKAQKEFKTEYREDTGADDTRDYLLLCIARIYDKADGAKAARSRFIGKVYSFISEQYRPIQHDCPLSEDRHISRLKSKN